MGRRKVHHPMRKALQVVHPCLSLPCLSSNDGDECNLGGQFRKGQSIFAKSIQVHSDGLGHAGFDFRPIGSGSNAPGQIRRKCRKITGRLVDDDQVAFGVVSAMALFLQAGLPKITMDALGARPSFGCPAIATRQGFDGYFYYR